MGGSASCIEAAPAPAAPIPLPAAAAPPFGGLEVRVEGCTLCLSCVNACPTHALSDNPERPMLRVHRVALCPVRIVRRDLPGKRHQH